MKKTITTSLVLSAILALAGCGGGSDSITSTADTVNTGTAYYLDSAIEGVAYSCGSQSGVTDSEGKFVFEEGKECQFTLAGIPVKTISSDSLIDGAKIVEDDLKVAKFLQSIDSDGDPTNGITIDDQVLEALTKALETVTDKAQVTEDETVMANVVATVGAEVEDVSGELRSDDEVEAHLTQTLTEVTKELLAGKTFWSVGPGDDSTPKLGKIVFSNDATSITVYEDDGTINSERTSDITIEDNKLSFSVDIDGSYTLIIQADGYIDADDRNADGTKDGIGHRLYTDKADAEAYLATLSTDQTSSTALNALVGKTIYQYCADNSELFQMTFQDNGLIKEIGNVETEYTPYIIDGDTIYTNYTTEDETEQAHILLEFTDTYIKFDEDNNETSIFYFTEADARANPTSINYGDGAETFANGITSGKVVFKDENGNTVSVPSDAYIRITSEENQVEGSWNGLRCKIQSDGSFGSQECFIYGDYDEMKTLFDTSNSFQVVVFKNHIEPDESNWNCSEDVYKYVGEGGASLWQNIEVLPSDYQDRSDETCNG